MNEQSIKNRYHASQVLVRDAGVCALQWFRNQDLLETEKKGPQDWVSQADHKVENMIHERLQTLFPEDGFLGEESGFRDLGAKGIWVVDPIDGTSCFLNGLPSGAFQLPMLLAVKLRLA